MGGGIFPVDTKRKNIHGSQVPFAMDCRGTDEDTWHLEKFVFSKVCGISVWLGKADQKDVMEACFPCIGPLILKFLKKPLQKTSEH